MHVPSILNTALFALCAAAATVPTPVEVLRRQHNAGTVITKCAKPGVLALAFDDGPYQCMDLAPSSFASRFRY